MDDLRTRLDALEQQTTTLTHHARRLTRQLRWWRGLACGLLALALLTWMLPMSTAQEDLHRDWRGLPERVAALEQKLQHLTSVTDAEGHPEMVITGANLRIVNGLDATDTANGLGNLIVGYNEPRDGQCEGPNERTGSHNVVIGMEHNFTQYGGVVVAKCNQISGPFAAVTGGWGNTASGFVAVVTGGGLYPLLHPNTIPPNNVASGDFAVVSGGGAVVGGGIRNVVRSDFASVSGGNGNTASGNWSSVSGGQYNTASGFLSSVSGGESNTASGNWSVVSGGRNRTAAGEFDWVAGSLVEDQ